MNQSLVAIFSILALILPGIFKSDRLADWQNGIIGLVVVGVFSLLTVLFAGSLTGNFLADWVLFSGVYGALLAGPGKPLDDWLTTHVLIPPKSS